MKVSAYVFRFLLLPEIRMPAGDRIRTHAPLPVHLCIFMTLLRCLVWAERTS